MIYAVHYVRIGQRLYTPGEVIDEKLDEEIVKSLLRRRAIKRSESGDTGNVIVPEVEMPPDAAKALSPGGTNAEHDTPNEDASEDEDAGDDDTEAESAEADASADDEAEDGDSEGDAPEDDEAGDAADDEGDGDAPVIEIDATDAIIDAPDEAPVPAPKTRGAAKAAGSGKRGTA